MTLLPQHSSSCRSSSASDMRRRVVMVDDPGWFKRMAARELQDLVGIEVTELTHIQDLFQNSSLLSEETLCLLIDESQLETLDPGRLQVLKNSQLPILGLRSAASAAGDASAKATTYPEMADLPNRIDVVDRDSPASLLRIVELVARLRDNLGHTVLVLYPETPIKQRIIELLRYYQLEVLVPSSVAEAVELLDQQPDIRLAVVGSHLGTMSGEEVLRFLRSSCDYERLAILGLSEMGDRTTAQSYLRSGANDFLLVPFVVEEFYCRVLNILRGIDLVERLSQAATRDHLTGLHNRRFLYDVGSKLFASSVRRQISISVAMVDIDHFKAINDTFGHEAGNIVLRRVAQILGNRFRKTDIVARIGGEEFAILMVNMSEAGMHDCFDTLKEKIAAESFIFNGVPVQVTVSIGVYDQGGESLQDLLDSADRLLYMAKSNGRNRIEYASSLARC